MKAKIVTKAIFLVLVLGFSSCTERQKARHKEKNITLPAEKTLQEAGVRKDTLYFLWKKYKRFNYKEKKYYNVKPVYIEEEQGIVFNIHNKEKIESFLFEDGSISETLPIDKLRDYHITSIKKVDSIHQSWHEKNKEIVKKKFSHWLETSPPIINKNFAYVVFVIVINDNKKTFTIYPVIWRDLEYVK